MENRDNSIMVGLYIREKLLKTNKELMSKISGDKIYGLRAHSNTTYPYIIFARTSIKPEYTKTMCPTGLNRLTITYHVVSNDYEESCDIANSLRHALEHHYLGCDDIYIREIELISAAENTDDDLFVQTLTFTSDVS